MATERPGMFNRFRSFSTPTSIFLIVSGDRVPFCAVEAAGSASRQNAAKQYANNLLFIIGFTSVIGSVPRAVAVALRDGVELQRRQRDLHPADIFAEQKIND